MSTVDGPDHGWLTELDRPVSDWPWKCIGCGSRFEKRLELLDHEKSCTDYIRWCGGGTVPLPGVLLGARGQEAAR